MKNILCLFIAIGLLGSCVKEKTTTNQTKSTSSNMASPEGVVISRQTEPDTIKKSIKSYVKATHGESAVIITYHSPAVRGRIIWGGLVPLDQVWVTGAHMATTFETNFGFMLGDKKIPAGKYGLFTIPGKEKWVVIINNKWNQHLADEYDSKEDVARINVIPGVLSENQERLQYEVSFTSKSTCTINVNWEKVQLSIPVTVVE